MTYAELTQLLIDDRAGRESATALFENSGPENRRLFRAALAGLGVASSDDTRLTGTRVDYLAGQEGFVAAAATSEGIDATYFHPRFARRV